jgi:hypothetical protein
MTVMKTIRFLMAMLIVVVTVAGIAESVCAAEKMGGMKTSPRAEKGDRVKVGKDMNKPAIKATTKTGRKNASENVSKPTINAATQAAQEAAAKTVKPEKDVQRKATGGKDLEIGKKADKRKKNA